jgi:hypothetical protein
MVRKDRQFFEERIRKLRSMKGKIKPKIWENAMFFLEFVMIAFETEEMLNEYMNQKPSTLKDEILQFEVLSEQLDWFLKVASLFILLSAFANLQTKSIIERTIRRISRAVNMYNKTHRFKLLFSGSLIKQKAMRDGLAILLRTLQGEDDTEWIGELIKTRNVEVLRVLPKSKRAKLSDELSRSLRLILM